MALLESSQVSLTFFTMSLLSPKQGITVLTNSPPQAVEILNNSQVQYTLKAHDEPCVLLACLGDRKYIRNTANYILGFLSFLPLCSLTAETFYSRSMILLITTFT